MAANLMMSATSAGQSLPEFIFGRLSTAEGRARRARSTAFGFYHDAVLDPLDPRPGEPVTINAQAGAGVAVAAATLHYTVDGSPPDSGAGAAGGRTTSVAMQRTQVAWDTEHWTYIEGWSAVIPGQPAGARVRYIVSALTTARRQIFSPHFDLQASEFLQDPGVFDVGFFERTERAGSPRVYEFQVDDAGVPGWLREAIIYQIFVDRFAPDPDTGFADDHDLAGFAGGTLKGILSQARLFVRSGCHLPLADAGLSQSFASRVRRYRLLFYRAAPGVNRRLWHAG